MKDICNGNAERDAERKAKAFGQHLLYGIEKQLAKGNFRMCEKPTQPLDYLQSIRIDEVWRFILSHPDMDHMDGLDALFDEVTIHNYWDSGVRRDKPPFKGQSRFNEDDWDRYASMIDGSQDGVRALVKQEGARFQFANRSDGNSGGGDGLYILAPNETLVDEVDDETNDASYVVLYRSIGGKVLLPGDAHDRTWEHVCKEYEDDVANCSILIAPHHGRDSDMDFGFLTTVNPKLVLMGCADSKDLAYDKYRNYYRISNNQAGNVVAEIDEAGMDVYVENERFAERYGDPSSTNSQGYSFMMRIDSDE